MRLSGAGWLRRLARLLRPHPLRCAAGPGRRPPGDRIATLALLAGILLAWRLAAATLQPAARYATLLLTLMLFLSVVGVWSSDPRMAAVNFINLIGGLGLVTYSWRVAITSEPSQWIDKVPGGLFCRLALGALTLTVLLGGLIGARYAAPACATLPDCQGAWWPAPSGWLALNPFATLAGPAGPDEAGGVALHLLHRYAALLAASLLIVVALRLRTAQRARNAVLAVLTLLLLEGLLGVLTVASGYSLWLAVAHNVGAALLLAAAASLMHAGNKKPVDHTGFRFQTAPLGQANCTGILWRWFIMRLREST